jgi:beta-galactosidase/beta-glucuronidase
MRKLALKIFFLSLLTVTPAFAQWKPAGDKIKTQWAEKVNPQNPLPEYPRPIMERSEWKNLNGLWNYAILDSKEGNAENFDGQILVPFAVESSLSGVMKTVGRSKCLWYERNFDVPSSWRSRNVLLHFGAVDWRADVYINDIYIGRHEGGYTGFTFNITPYLKSGKQKIVVKVWDPTDDGIQAIGKQRNRPEGIWYTSVTGIWQTVWIEPVNAKHINKVVATSDIDNATLSVRANITNGNDGDVVKAVLKDGATTVAEGMAAAGEPVILAVKDAKLWSTTSPFLYDLSVQLLSGGKQVDAVKSYAAMRKISTKRDAQGIVRLQLNNQDMFQMGPLDQGYWPDGLYTAPTDEALKFDIQKTKDFGFNMIRKHMKVEPARWYTWCDRLGIVVWQDMPSSDFENSPRWQNHQYFNGAEAQRSDASEANYKKEWKDEISQFKVYPCIVVWTPFNEAWGQFKTKEIVAMTKKLDPSRLVNPSSGGNFYATGDICDLHNYPAPAMYLYDGARTTVLGEFGGLGLPVKDHLWKDNGNWGYVQFKNGTEVTNRYVELTAELLKLVKAGFSAGVYTQTTDVEGEVNGLMTYDRKVIKIDESRVKEANDKLTNSLK